MRAKVSSLELPGLLQLLARLILALPLMVSPAVAQMTELPILFDARERLARPDVNDILRLRFLTTADFPPFNFTDQTGRLAGFHVDLARALCAELGMENRCQIQALPYEQLATALEGGQGEAVLAGVAVTSQLRERFRFTRPYLLLPARFLTNKQASLARTDARALYGKPVGVIKGTAHEAMLRAFFPDVKAQGFDTRDAMLEALKAKKVDAVFADALQLSFWMTSPASAGCCDLFDGPYLSEQFLGEGMTIMVGGQDARLSAALESALAAVSRDGRLEEIYLRYFPTGIY
ncbi:transporter substrate-binding domain-containing protein [Rhizobium sp. G187]|uniref:transporter substrate-binding domain-containing protein n=1 Tax=Rhizobium sp. G187 TaxID=3451352 RepID=UPI003EE67680